MKTTITCRDHLVPPGRRDAGGINDRTVRAAMRGFWWRFWTTALVVLVAGAGGFSARAEGYPDAEQIALLGELQEELYNDRYEAAEETAREMIGQYPGDGLGYLFRGIILVTAAYDAEEEVRAAEFHECMDRAEELAREQVKTSQMTTRAWGFLVLGHVESYRAMWEARFGSKLAAARKGRAGAEYYERGLRADSTVYDLYFGLGLYHYWKSAKAGVLRWLGMVADDQEKGLGELEVAAQRSMISREAARSALVWVELDRGEYEEVIRLGESMMRRYPESRSLMWPTAEAYCAIQQYADAASVYGRLREAIRERPGNYYNLIECDYRIAKCYEGMGLPGEWAAAAAEVSGYLGEVSEETRERQWERLEYLGVAGR